VSGTVGPRLRGRRLQLGLKLADVAEVTGLSLPYIANLERGRGNPTLAVLNSLAEALRLPLAELLGEGESASDVLADMPASLRAFAASQRFKKEVERLAEETGQERERLREQLLLSMAAAPRRSSGQPTEDDWRRLLDTYVLLLRD